MHILKWLCPLRTGYLTGLLLCLLISCQPVITQKSSNESFSTSLPLFIINSETAIVDEPKVTAQMRIINNGEGELNYETDPATDYEGYIGIEIRGQSSQRYPKKQYGLETREASGDNNNVSILGLPKENDWVLYAPYSDKTLMRNVLAYQTARDLGQYASRTVFGELILNGEYKGVYVFMEKLKLDKNRVAAEDRDDSGAYLLEMTLNTKLNAQDAFFRTPVTNQPIVYYDPDLEDLSEDDASWIAAYVATFEQALFSEQFRDPETGYRAYLEIDSAVDYVLINELFKNEDAFRASTFMYKGVNEKLKMGPVWDFNISMGNTNYGPSSRLEGWMLARRPWTERLYQDEAFVEKMVTRWTELREEGLLENLLSTIDHNVDYLEAAQKRNFERWPSLGKYVWPNPTNPETGEVRQSYEEEIDFLKTWLTERVSWIDEHITDSLPLAE